jgi:stage III sporulation protein AG
LTEKVIEKWKLKLRNMKKEDYIVLVLIGVLLLIISLPTDREKDAKGNISISGEENGQEGGKAAKIESGTEENTEKTEEKTGGLNKNTCYDIDSYVENLEKRVEEMLSGMAGAGKVQVMITVSDTGTEILEKDTEINAADLEETDDAGGRRKNTESGQREEAVYFRDAEGNEIPYVVQRKLPEVTGVVVIAEGAGNETVKENIIGAVGVLFNLNEHRIKVIRMKS